MYALKLSRYPVGILSDAKNGFALREVNLYDAESFGVEGMWFICGKNSAEGYSELTLKCYTYFVYN